MIHLFVNIFAKLFFLMTPFFCLSMFLAYTHELPARKRKFIALEVTLTVAIVCVILFFFGETLFNLMGITLDAFRIGAGSLLFLTSVKLVSDSKKSFTIDKDTTDFTIVPLSIPITVGPGTIGGLLVIGAELQTGTEKAVGTGALLCAVLCVGLLMLSSSFIEKLIKSTGIKILSKLTGLVLAALAAQIIFTGIRNFLYK